MLLTQIHITNQTPNHVTTPNTLRFSLLANTNSIRHQLVHVHVSQPQTPQQTTPNPIHPKQANAKTQIPTGYTAEVPFKKYLNLPSPSRLTLRTYVPTCPNKWKPETRLTCISI
jgi:hypothetical protein